MTGKEFLNALANGKGDVLQDFLNLLDESGGEYCLIGGLAVNAYAEPVVSLYLDVVVASRAIEGLKKAVEGAFSIEEFPHSQNLKSPRSDLRIQIQTDERYQAFLQRATTKTVLGYEMKVAAVEDVLRGKIWAYSDEQRRPSKRQKDLADIFRLVETHPALRDLLPESIPWPEI
jgi:hypothetical protein